MDSEQIALIVLVALSAGAILPLLLNRIFNRSPREDDGPPPYTRQPFVLSKAEYSFFVVLRQVVPPDVLVLVKVRLAEVLGVKRGPQYIRHFRKISQKQIDFLLCDRQTRPILVIELNEVSHLNNKRAERDDFLDTALQVAGLPILRVASQKTYQLNDVRDAVEKAWADAQAAASVPGTPSEGPRT
ncbi:MAG: DUF2726 domain-containing protein [Capsulimonadaceae bacterium]